MKHLILTVSTFLVSIGAFSQSFNRTELSTDVSFPWEIVYGPDNFLWITETGGVVSRIDPTNGAKTVVYTAPDYFGGSPLENSIHCPNSAIGSGTLGLDLHPGFLNSETSFIYYVYSYNSGTTQEPATKFRIKRLTWNASLSSVIADSNIVNNITSGYDHLGGRLMAIEQNGIPYLFLTIGDNGKSDQNSPDCYVPQSTNPNNFTQDVTAQNGKVHRFNIDGSVPSDNPIPGNSFYTRGHRNPQGLMYNNDLNILYDIEHGDRTDDEINVLYKGMNYGWKQVRGYHNDQSFVDEQNFVSTYVAHPQIPNDSLVQPLYSWCTEPSTSSTWTDWCTVAPSDGVYYGSAGIPEWTNSLLVVTLKDGLSTDREVFQFKLDSNGKLVPSTVEHPNPKKFFGGDQTLNGRLRDIAVSSDGKTIYLINNGGADKNKITIYEYDSSTSIGYTNTSASNITLYPNPILGSKAMITGIPPSSKFKVLAIHSAHGVTMIPRVDSNLNIDTSNLSSGVYVVYLMVNDQPTKLKFVKL